MKKQNLGEVVYSPPRRIYEENMWMDSNVPVEVSGDNKPNAIESFRGAGLLPILVENVKKYGFEKPTPVQMHGIPIVMASRDVMACAQSGSGKTAAFLLPIIHRLIQAAEYEYGAGPQCIVITPTRKLAVQVYTEACRFACGSMVKNVVAYDGTITPVNQLQRGCNILIATPDMLLDLLEKRGVSLTNCKYLVLDEADRMWDGMEFVSEIQKLIEDPNMPWGERQTLIFAETLPDEMQESAQEFMAEDYIFLCSSVGVRKSTSSFKSDFESDSNSAATQMKASPTAVEGNGHDVPTSEISVAKKSAYGEAMVKHLKTRVDDLQMKELEWEGRCLKAEEEKERTVNKLSEEIKVLNKNLQMKEMEWEGRCLKAEEEKERTVNKLSEEIKGLNKKMSEMQRDLLTMVEHCLKFENALSQTKEENRRMEKEQILGEEMSNERATRNKKCTVEEVSNLKTPGVSSNRIVTSLGSIPSSSMSPPNVLDLPQVQPPNPRPTEIMWHHPTSVPVYTPGQPRLPVYHQGQSNQHYAHWAPVGIDGIAQYLSPVAPPVTVPDLSHYHTDFCPYGQESHHQNPELKPLNISPELAKIIGTKKGEQLYMPQVIKKLWAYIKENNLLDPNNEDFFTPDKAMEGIFGTKRQRYFMSKHLSEHLNQINPNL